MEHKKSFRTPHLQAWAESTRNMDIDWLDDRCEERIWTKNYIVSTESFSGKCKYSRPSQYTAYTDGSETKEGVGLAFVVYHNSHRIQVDNISMPDDATVF